MLSQAENAYLTQTGPGTPMGNLLRQYWTPALRSFELPSPDCPPLRLRLLSENMIAFRVTSGAVGIIADACPHRGASMFFGRNEEEGLRCVYHGWKFDVAGECTDMPSEPAESNFKAKVKATAYAVRERNGVIWVYMGPRAEPPPLPDVEFNTVPESHTRIGNNLRECSWVQAVEGGIDSAHSALLHSQVDHEKLATTGVKEFVYVGRSHQPLRYQVIVTDAGVLGGARREAREPNHDWWRVNVFLMPFYTMFPGNFGGALGGHAFVPVDDHNTMCWNITWNPREPLAANTLAQGRALDGADDGGFHPNSSDWLGRFRMVAHRTNDYSIDYEAQKNLRFSGVPSVNLQDTAVQESMGQVIDRTKEHLGSIDAMIIAMRRRLLRSARALEGGVEPKEVDNPALVRLRTLQMLLPRDKNWLEVGGDWMFGRSTVRPEEANALHEAPRPVNAQG